MVGAQTPPGVGTSSMPSCSGRVATVLMSSQVCRSVLRWTGRPGRYSKVLEGRRHQEGGGVDEDDAPGGVDAREERVHAGTATDADAVRTTSAIRSSAWPT